MDMEVAENRAQFFADTLGLKPPERLLDAEGVPTTEFLTFCRDTGMSLDWVFLGDLRPMVRAIYRARSHAG